MAQSDEAFGEVGKVDEVTTFLPDSDVYERHQFIDNLDALFLDNKLSVRRRSVNLKSQI